MATVYANSLAAYRDKDLQKQTLTAEQLPLQDEIAADMQLKVGERRNVTYLSVGYAVTGIMRYTDAGDVLSCTITYADIHETIT
jgi:hypothetical protein